MANSLQALVSVLAACNHEAALTAVQLVSMDSICSNSNAWMQEYDTYLAQMYLQTLMDQPDSEHQLPTDSSGALSARARFTSQYA